MAHKALNTTQAARRLGVSDRRVRQLAREYEIGSRNAGRLMLTSAEIRRLDRRKKVPGVLPGTTRA